MQNTKEPLSLPSHISLLTEGVWHTAALTGKSACWGEITVELAQTDEALNFYAMAQNVRLSEIVLHWEREFPAETLYTGGAWERGYGDLHWGCRQYERVFPWYLLANAGGITEAYGVKVRPGAICWWAVSGTGIALHLDVRCGGDGVLLQGRKLCAASAVYRRYTEGSAFEAARSFCGVMCTDPVLPAEPVYGGNNWYYAYGNSSHQDILSDTAQLAELCRGLDNRPFFVTDDGWQIQRGDGYIGGPWRAGNNRFPDMKALAAEIRAQDVRPGIWVRLLQNRTEELGTDCRLRKTTDLLDPSHPAVQAYIAQDLHTVTEWGYELIKHDFSTFDLLGRWGSAMGRQITDSGWTFHNPHKTTAEIITDFYRLIYEAAGGRYILGCNCVGHLGAGLMHLNRTGDDTSGVRWERTRRMGVNTLAFTLPQHNRFFAIDADCIGITGEIPWTLNSRWLKLLANSGTPLFASIKPGVLTDGQKQELKAAFRLASLQGSQPEPLDWTGNTCPARWDFGGEPQHFLWTPADGMLDFTT